MAGASATITRMPSLANHPLTWDIFCTVIDNYGDLGVCWRLAVNLAQRGQQVRLWIDQPDNLQWLAPHGHPGVQVQHWQHSLHPASWPNPLAHVLIEAFGCTLDDSMQAHWARHHAGQHTQGLWLNLEYLTAESYAARCHLLRSPVMQGPAAGCSKQFFYPGFTADTGGLLREAGLLDQQQAFDHRAWLQQRGCQPDAPLTISLFGYEPTALPQLMNQLATTPSQLLVTQGRSLAAVQQALQPNADADADADLPRAHGACQLHALPWLPQTGFDHLLWSSHLNCVRGEDSLVRALWAGQPLVWQIYPQHDNAHHAKLNAFLDWLQAPHDLRLFHHVWNGMRNTALPALTPQRLDDWRCCIQTARAQLLQQDDLATQLIRLAQHSGFF